jgi:hypothetical protein
MTRMRSTTTIRIGSRINGFSAASVRTVVLLPMVSRLCDGQFGFAVRLHVGPLG